MQNDFLLGSIVSVLPIFYIGEAYKKLSCQEQKQIDYVRIATSLPIVYGITFVVLKKFFKNYFVLGAVAGLFYSLMGRFVLNLPKKLFKMKNETSVHLIAPMMYALVYGVIVKKLKSK